MSNVYIPKVGDKVWVSAMINVLDKVNLYATFTDEEKREIEILQKQIERGEGFIAVVSRSQNFSFEFISVVVDDWLEFSVPPEDGVKLYVSPIGDQIVKQLPMVEKPKQIDKFVITDVNLSVREFCVRYDIQDCMCFYSGKKSGFPAMEVSGDYRLVGTFEVIAFDNDTVYIRQN